jgi:hypothetical protein
MCVLDLYVFQDTELELPALGAGQLVSADLHWNKAAR